MRTRQSIKLFVILLLCSTYIFSFSHFGAFAYDTFLDKDGSFNEGTMIGTVNISGQTKKEASTLLNEKWANWQNETKITVHYKEKTEVFDNSLFTFMEEETYKHVKQGQKNKLFVEVESVETFLHFISPTLTTSILDVEKWKRDLLAKAQALESRNIEFQLEDYLLDPALEKNHLIGEVTLHTELSGYEKDVINKHLHEIELAPMTQFSLLKHAEDVGIKSLSPGTMSLIATGMYELILPTDFSVIERNISQQLPSYSKLGYEAKVNEEKNMDFVFSNGNKSRYTIFIEAKNGQIVFSLKGPSFLQQYKIITKGQQIFTPKTIVQFNPQLLPGQKIVETEGKEGQIITVIREIYTEKGDLVTTENISEDFYPPVHQVEVHGLIVEQDSSDENEEDSSNNAPDSSSSVESEDSDESTSSSTENDEDEKEKLENKNE